MLPLRLEPIIGVDGVAAWEVLVDSLPADGLYHGTSLARAERIVSEGFRASFGHLAADDKIDTYWGSIQVAANFAYGRSALDGCPPAILQADLEDVIASGAPMALRTSCDDIDVEYPSWRECYAETRSFWVKGGRFVRGLTLHCIQDAIPEVGS